jgi:hypothetical protein
MKSIKKQAVDERIDDLNKDFVWPTMNT